jgi:hypothetical protein
MIVHFIVAGSSSSCLKVFSKLVFNYNDKKNPLEPTKNLILNLKIYLGQWLVKDLFKRKQLQANDSWVTWCEVERSNQVFRALVQHGGRGKYKILNDNQERIHVGKIVDASDIINCEK